MGAYGESISSPISVRPTTGTNIRTNSVAASWSNTSSTSLGGVTPQPSAFPHNSLYVTKLPVLESGTCITSDNTKQRCIRCR